MTAFLPRFERFPVPTVLLLHELPCGSSHIDWMIAREPNGVEPLITFRTSKPLDELSRGEVAIAERAGDHRPMYLAYEGAVSRNRGTVRRIGRGEVISRTEMSEEWTMTVLVIEWRRPDGNDFMQHLQLLHLNEQQVRVTCIARGQEGLFTIMESAGTVKEAS